jgi:hypothetical protein
MGSLSSAIDWWDEWKLRILVLCSFSFQFFLFFSGIVRNWYVLRRLRLVVWLAYIGSDALAIYALATLFNRQKQQQDGGGSALEVIWAPVLLFHLGGQPFISAYSLEDSELWRRHAITLVSQVTVALYVFCKWWSGEKRLLQAAILLFVVGIIKFGQKPWALRRANYSSMTSTYLLSMARRDSSSAGNNRWSRLGRVCIVACTTDCRDIQDQLMENRRRRVGEKGINYSLKEYVIEAAKHVHHHQGERKENEDYTPQPQEGAGKLKDLYRLFLDVSAPYSVRLHYLRSSLHMDDEDQHNMLRSGINLQFSAIYTKVRSELTCLGRCTSLVLRGLVIASLVLFATSDKDGYDKSDIMVTYILFFSTVVIELGPFFIDLLCPCLFQCKLMSQPLLWQDMVSQHNIMSFCARDKKPPTLMKLATFSCLGDFINKHWYVRHQCEARQISVLVRRHAEDGWNKYIHDPATYRRFNNLRGEHALKKMSKHLATDLLEEDKLGWTFNRPFDEYVLLWHIATDLCLHHTSSSTNNTTTASSSQSQDTIKSRRSSSEIISNYMIYLLFICPEMLIPGTRYDLFTLACHEIECMINESPLSSSPDKTRSGIAQWILGMDQDDQRMNKAPRNKIFDAHKLARLLVHSLNEEQRWEVIQGVWVEMLCYSASRCRGYLHAKSLGVAPEFHTNVWLLWWCMGMQTLPDMMHNLGPPEDPPQEQTAAEEPPQEQTAADSV